MSFDAVLVLSFGGPDGPDDVMPFLRNVVRGRDVPDARLETVAGQYMLFGGRSPINGQNRALVDAVGAALSARGRPLPVYFGNRNWDPYLADTLAVMASEGVERAAVFVTSAYSSFSGCRQYLDDIDSARRDLGPDAPELVKLPAFYDRPGFVGPLAAGLRAALESVGADTPVIMTAHSIPVAQAAHCEYQRQLQTTAGLVAAAADIPAGRFSLAFQSRSGPPHQPWLEPDLVEVIEGLPGSTTELVVVPIGFVSDHMEVVYDLDHLAAGAASDRSIRLVRTPTPGVHPDFVGLVCDLVAEAETRPVICPPQCCRVPSG